MSNAIYPLFKQTMLSPGADLVHGRLGNASSPYTPITAPLTAALLSGYTYSTAHQYKTSINSYIIGTPVALAGVTASTTGVLNATATTFTAVPAKKIATVTAVAGTGTTATLTFATQSVAPYAIGQTIQVSGIASTDSNPGLYNGLAFVVTGCNQTTVSYACAATGTLISSGTNSINLGITSIALYMNTGTTGTSPLAVYLNTVDPSVPYPLSSSPIVPTGGNIIINWSTLSQYIFAL
jgi:hypothetical protein